MQALCSFLMLGWQERLDGGLGVTHPSAGWDFYSPHDRNPGSWLP